MLSENDARKFAQTTAFDILEVLGDEFDDDEIITDLVKRIVDCLSTCLAVHGKCVSDTFEAMINSSGGSEN